MIAEGMIAEGLNLLLMLMAMAMGALYMAFEALTGIQLFGMDVEHDQPRSE